MAEPDPFPRFLQRLTHDLGSSLTAVQGFASLLRDHLGSGLDVRGDMYLNRIDRAVAHAEGLLSHLRHLYQMDRQSTRSEPVALSTLVPPVLEKVLDRVGDAEFQVAEDLPVVRGDADLLHLALLEVVTNAATFVEPEVAATVRIDWCERDGDCRLEVADNGIGIPPAADVLAPMVRACNEETYPGLGLGLTIAARAVAACGGRITLQPGASGGTICCLHLKLA